MAGIPVILIFDVGKTNKKFLLFDEQYQLVNERTVQLDEIKDEDGFTCEDVNALTIWVKDSFKQLIADEKYNVKAVNFSAYGASFVYLDEKLNIIAPLYNYLKSYPPELKEKFYNTYGGESEIAKATASPVLGNLNSGMQLYRLKYEKPEVFEKIKYALHLPQYLSFILTGNLCSDITSIGCHTNLWHFQNNKYHTWVATENIAEKLAPIKDSDEKMICKGSSVIAGIGLHDSSAALIPYIISNTGPFVLISTGTWCITLNPFNHSALSDYELHQDCLCYLTYEGKQVKASRLFAGYEHEQQTKRLSGFFKKHLDYYKHVTCDLQILHKIKQAENPTVKKASGTLLQQSAFGTRDLNTFSNYEEAYHQLIADIVLQQVQSTNLVLKETNVKNIFVDGGFSSNQIYMNLLAKAFPGTEVYAASMPQATALGAALSIHRHWNNNPVPQDIVKLDLKIN